MVFGCPYAHQLTGIDWKSQGNSRMWAALGQSIITTLVDISRVLTGVWEMPVLAWRYMHGTMGMDGTEVPMDDPKITIEGCIGL